MQISSVENLTHGQWPSRLFQNIKDLYVYIILMVINFWLWLLSWLQFIRRFRLNINHAPWNLFPLVRKVRQNLRVNRSPRAEFHLVYNARVNKYPLAISQYPKGTARVGQLFNQYPLGIYYHILYPSCLRLLTNCFNSSRA